MIEHDSKRAKRGTRNSPQQMPSGLTIRFPRKRTLTNTCTKAYKLLTVPVQKTQKQTSAQQVEARFRSGLDQNRTAGFSVIDLDGSEI